MKVHGYCERCHKIKRVQVGTAAMVAIATNRPVYGLCDDCEQEERQATRARHPSRGYQR
jgi:hypothetical protein